MQNNIRIYNQLPDEERKEWASKSQLNVGWGHLFNYNEEIEWLATNDEVRKEVFLIIDENYEVAVNEGSQDKYVDTMYYAEKFYNIDDIKKLCDAKNIPVNGLFEQKLNLTKREKSVRQFLQDKKCLDNAELLPISFYGNEKASVVTQDEQYRMFYSLFIWREFIDYTFMRLMDFKPVELSTLRYLYANKFIRYLEIYDIHTFRFLSRPERKRILAKFTELGYIKELDLQSFKHIYKREKVKLKDQMFMLTDKGERLGKLYYEYIFFKRKLPYLGVGTTSYNHSTSEFTKKSDQRKGKTNYKHISDYYEISYEYINAVTKTNFIGEEMERKLTSESMNQQLMFQPYLYLLLKKNYIRSKGKNKTNKYIKSFMDSMKFGADVGGY